MNKLLIQIVFKFRLSQTAMVAGLLCQSSPFIDYIEHTDYIERDKGTLQ